MKVGSPLQTNKRTIVLSVARSPQEGRLLPAGSVPTFLPGKNETLHDYAIEYGLPIDSALGGAETLYPEYIKKMKTMKKEPRTTTTHFRRIG